MHRRIIHLDDHAIDVDGVGDLDGVAKTPADNFSQAGLAVARRTIEQDRPAGVDGGPQTADQRFRHDEPGQTLVDDVPADLLAEELLTFDLGLIVVQGHRHRADILALLQRLCRPLAALAGKGETHFGTGTQAGNAQGFQEITVAGGFDEFIHDADMEARFLG